VDADSVQERKLSAAAGILDQTLLLQHILSEDLGTRRLVGGTELLVVITYDDKSTMRKLAVTLLLQQRGHLRQHLKVINMP
jgi:hypothetical protein